MFVITCSVSRTVLHATSPCRELNSWRTKRIDMKRAWGAKGPQELRVTELPTSQRANSLTEWGRLVLSTEDPETKAALTHHAYTQWCHGLLTLGTASPPLHPARPPKPHLLPAKEIPSPKDSPLPHNAYLLHNLVHVELNAIDLAWDTVVRFSSLSDTLGLQFFSDFAHVADDESRHFGWCSQRLAELGFRYGDMPAHNLLWNECKRTSNNIIARLAIIPMVQEARGLDAGPRLVQKLVGLGDNKTSEIVARIADEEVAHVAVGVSWFLKVCEEMGCMPDKTFKDLIRDLKVELKGPFNHSARKEAGIPQHWYDNQMSIS